jgi:hypothetical protein
MPATPTPLLFAMVADCAELLLSPQRVARIMGRSARFVLELCDAGRLEAFSPPGRKVSRRVITRRSLVLVLAEDVEQVPEDCDTRLDRVLLELSSDQLQRLAAKAKMLANRL